MQSGICKHVGESLIAGREGGGRGERRKGGEKGGEGEEEGRGGKERDLCLPSRETKANSCICTCLSNQHSRAAFLVVAMSMNLVGLNDDLVHIG